MENGVGLDLARMDRHTLARDKSLAVLDAPEYSDHLTMLCRYFEQAEDQTREARKLSERDKDYYHNDQLTAEELATLQRRGQPPVISNQIKRKVETMRGLERRQRSDPKAYPRTPDEEPGAEAATDALRFVGDQTNFNEIRSLVYEDMIVCGYGGVDIIVEQKPQDARIDIQHVPWERLGYDPHSVRADFSDAKYKFIVIWLDRADAIAQYGDYSDAIESTLSIGNADLYQDTPQDGMWCDSKRTRLRVVQMHYKEGEEWMLATFTKGGYLVPPVVSPYLGKDGKSACSLHMRALYIDRNGNRYGAVRDFISLQDEINKRRSKALHLLSVRQSYGNKTAVADAQKTRTQLAKPDGHVELNGGAKFGEDFGILPTGDMAAGQVELLQQALLEMQATGANAALAGTDTREQSGRAQQLQQQAGQATLEPGIDGLRMFARDVYEAVWSRIRQFWNAEKWVRVTDDERNLKWVGLNKPVTLGAKLQQIMAENPELAKSIAKDAGVLSPYDDKLKMIVERENDVTELDVDIVIEEGPDLASLQSEQFETLAELAKAGLPIPPKAIIQASSIRNKDAILDEMEKGGQLSPETQAQLEQRDQQIAELQKALQAAQAEQQKTQQALQQKDMDQSALVQKASIESESGAQIALRKAQIDAQAKVAIARIDADTDVQIEAHKAGLLAQQQAEAKANEPEPTGPDTDAQIAESLALLAQAMAEFAEPKPPMVIVHERDEQTGLLQKSYEVPA